MQAANAIPAPGKARKQGHLRCPFSFAPGKLQDVKTEPIRPARIDFTAEGVPFAPDFDDIFHPRAGALRQAQHVFLGGNGLPERWQGREEFTILETGFGLGNNFLATWAAWRCDPPRPRRLYFISIEKHPLRRDDLARSTISIPSLCLRPNWSRTGLRSPQTCIA